MIITQKNIDEFNKRCSLLLGGTDNTFMCYFHPIEDDQVNLSFDIFDESIFSNDGGSTWKIKDLKFRTSWDWIMAVLDHIIKIGWSWKVENCSEIDSHKDDYLFRAFISNGAVVDEFNNTNTINICGAGGTSKHAIVDALSILIKLL